MEYWTVVTSEDERVVPRLENETLEEFVAVVQKDSVIYRNTAAYFVPLKIVKRIFPYQKRIRPPKQQPICKDDLPF